MLKGPRCTFSSVGRDEGCGKEALLSSLVWACALRATSQNDGKGFERTG